MDPLFRHIRDLQHLRDLDQLDAVRVPRRVVVDRSNPFETMADVEFLSRFRLNKETVINLIEAIRGDLPQAANRKGNLICFSVPYTCSVEIIVKVWVIMIICECCGQLS